MPLTPEQKVKMQQKVEGMPDALKRDPLVDYTHGWFFVTLNTRGEVPVLSTCAGDVNILNGPNTPHCIYTALGVKVKEIWATIPHFHKGVIIDDFEAMPEHIHGLLFLTPENKEHLGQIMKGFMIGCSHAYWDILGINWRKSHPTNGTLTAGMHMKIATPELVDRDHSQSYRGPSLFVHGYNDVEPITAEEVKTKRQYIHDQARKRLIQGVQSSCFVKYRHQHSRNWSVDKITKAICQDHCFQNDETKCQDAQQHVLTRLNDGVDYLGNKDLLMCPRKLPIICHRVDIRNFDRQKEAVLQAAREGAVIVSAFISPKEREIKKQLMMELLPFIEIMDNGFAERYKPSGKAFYAMAENRLLQMTCWNYLYQKDVKVSREMCLVMNELVRVICGIDENWWKSGY